MEFGVDRLKKEEGEWKKRGRVIEPKCGVGVGVGVWVDVCPLRRAELDPDPAFGGLGGTLTEC